MSNQQKQNPTIRFSFPAESCVNVESMRCIGKDLLVYAKNENFDDVKETFEKMGLTVVMRKERVDRNVECQEQECTLHVSAADEETVVAAFSEMGTYELKKRSVNGRYVCTITATDKQQYDLMLGKDGDSVRVKPFERRYANPSNRDRADYQRTDQRTDRPNYQRTDRPNYQRTDQQTDRQNYQRTDRRSDQQTDRRSRQQTDRRSRQPSQPSQENAYSTV